MRPIGTRFLRLAAMAVLAALALPGWTASREAERSSDRDDPSSAGELVAGLRTDLEDILRGTGGRWRSARWSVLAVSLDTGDTLFAENPSQALAPASNMKLLTTAAALHHLGPEFRYRTFLLADGPVEDGRIRGDLVLYGTGDPGISERFQPTSTTVFEAFADSLLALGVVLVEGEVVGDGSYFEGPALGDSWQPEDLNDGFAAPSAGLVLGESVFTLRVDPLGTEGETPRAYTVPEGAGVRVHNLARIGSGTRLRIRRQNPTQPVLIDGWVPRGGREVGRELTVPDPADFAASVLRSALERKGIRVLGGTRSGYAPGRSPVTGKRLWAPAFRKRKPPRVLASHTSPPLKDYLAVVNKRSHNLLAEQVFRTVGRVAAGDGSYAGGARAVRSFLAGVAGVDTTQLAIHDGSGLSHMNRVSAADFVAVTAYMAKTEHWSVFWETLPEAGNPRELRRMYRTPAQGNLRAKTGTIRRVSALSGMVRSANGERIAFSILSNQVPSTTLAKRIEDRIGTRLASFQRPFGAQGSLAQRGVPSDNPGAPPDVVGSGAGRRQGGGDR